MKVINNLKPIYNKYSKVLILGSIPSITSRKSNFYYSHKTNRFWTIIENVFNVSLNSNDEKTQFLLDNNIVLYDIIKECDITNSSDSTIKNIKTNDIESIIKNTNIKHVFCDGTITYKIFLEYFSNLNVYSYYLPSPSTRNVHYKLNDLINIYKIIKEKAEN